MDSFFNVKRKPAKNIDGGEKPKEVERTKGNIPWVEKYRPAKMEDVSHQEEVVASLQSCIKGEDMPHMLFYGPPGTGKTSTILALSKELFGQEYYRDRILELNASDERGINVVREKVKNFAGSAVAKRLPDGRVCPPIKLVILDEADSMTNAAQAALRRTIEKHSRTTRLQMIADSEDVSVTKDALLALAESSEGDLRKAITFLQSVSRLKLGEDITEIDVQSVSGFISHAIIQEWLEVVCTGTFEQIRDLVTNMINEGYPAGQLLSQLHDQIIDHEGLTDAQKSRVTEKLAICDQRLMDGASEYLQLMDISTEINKRFTQ